MQHRKWLWLTASLFGILAVAILGYTFFGAGQAVSNQPDAAGKNGRAADTLPIKQVVLFNSGVGYFQREGEIDGDSRVQLSFQTSDINDLLKSLTLADPKGKVGSVSYDSADPIDKILRSFALDLTHNPTFGQILNQARGEKIEVTRNDKTKVAGVIIGMETQKRPVGKDQTMDVEILNLNATGGIQAIPMNDVVSVRFSNPVLEAEFQRALSVLAMSHDTQKKTVSVGFLGEGKRQVKVGYVVERPIWKTTYRMEVDNKGKVFLQGWALVENTSDDDWNDVRMVLVSGKPISFKMNLYDPIYIPRPTVEPEQFASLRPPVYAGSMSPDEMKKLADMGIPMDAAGRPMPVQFPAAPGAGGFGGAGYGPAVKEGKAFNQFQQQNLNQLARDMADKAQNQNKLSYEEMLRRKQESQVKVDQAKKAGEMITGFNFKEGIKSVATADEIGDYFQYSIDQKISLQRQKSAMLPILNQTVEGEKVSIFNEATHAKYPLLGLKIKNTSGKPLTQGPITVYDSGIFGGDTRILDVQPNEERLLSYALDQGTEVKTDIKTAPSPDMIFRIGTGQLSARYYVRQTKTYSIKNRSTHDRTVILEHPIKAEWKLFEPKKPVEQTRDLYRFQVSVPAGKLVTYDVIEDMPRVDNFGQQPSYAIASGINVKVDTGVDYNRLIGLKINKGFLVTTHKTRETKAYHVQNLSDMDRNFTVDHVVRPGWSRLDDKGDPTNGPEVFRFKLAIGKGKTGSQSVREERTHTDGGVLIKSLGEAQIKAYINTAIASADIKASLTKALSMQAKVDETRVKIAGIEKELTILTADHTRVRENLKIVPQTSEHYKAFLEKFVAQDKQIETYQKQVRDLNATMQAQIRDYDQWLSKLDAE
jgi:hypothetical protein